MCHKDTSYHDSIKYATTFKFILLYIISCQKPKTCNFLRITIILMHAFPYYTLRIAIPANIFSFTLS